MQSAIEEAVRVCGTQAALAVGVGVTPTAVKQWLVGIRQVPEARCPAIERLTGGVVACERLRPNVRWARMPDLAWPWHPAGRPLLDVSASVK